MDGDAVRRQLDRILASSLFQHSRRYPGLLRYVVEKTLEGERDSLKERTLGVEVFRRSPEYDTSADPVVRTTASEIRKRLDEYYADEAHAGELRIVLPVGSYVPEFRVPAVVAAFREPDIHAVREAPKRNRWRVWAGAAVLTVAIVGAAGFWRTRESQLHRFWAPVFQSPSVLMVVETLMGVPTPVTEGSPPVQEMIDPSLFLVVNDMNSRLAGYFGANGVGMEYELARNVTPQRLRQRPFVLNGAFNNRLTQRAVAGFRYSLHLDSEGLVRKIVDRNDSNRHWDSPMGTLTRDYALIARAPEPQTGQMMVVIAGLGERGSAAATEFLTNPVYMEQLARNLPDGWARKNIEIVLKTDLVGGDWGTPRVVDWVVW